MIPPETPVIPSPVFTVAFARSLRRFGALALAAAIYAAGAAIATTAPR